MEFIHSGAEEAARQEIPTIVGISGATTSAQGISMSLTMFEPGGHSNCHMHVGSESALYVLRGSAHFFGQRLEHDQLVSQGDFIYVPPSCPHKRYNRSRTERVVFVVGRTDAQEQERVVATPDADDGSSAARVDCGPTHRATRAGPLSWPSEPELTATRSGEKSFR
jgi:uncharacterized RmlC-like cupin family protein